MISASQDINIAVRFLVARKIKEKSTGKVEVINLLSLPGLLTKLVLLPF